MGTWISEATKNAAVRMEVPMILSISSLFSPIDVQATVTTAPLIKTGADKIPSEICMRL